MQKKTIAGRLDAEIRDEYDDYDEMLRRKHAEGHEINEQAQSVRNRLQERRERAKKKPEVEGLSKEEQEAMMKNYET